MKLLILACASAFFLTSCQKFDPLSHRFDSWSFELTGGTLFSSPFQVTTKQLHFDTGELFGKDIIIEGDVDYFGTDFTHLLLSDSEGKMLVVTTSLVELYKDFKGVSKARVRVLGRLERGKKGLPYFLARSVDTLNAVPN